MPICGCGRRVGLPAHSYIVALSLPLARSLFPAQSLSGLPVGVSLLPPHRMSGELVETALADRSSIKPFQFIPIHSRSRIGCRMMCPACCLSSSVSCVVSRLACLPLTHPLRSSASPLAPPCVSLLRYVSSRRLTPSLASSHPLILPALVSHAASLCLLSPSLVSVGGASLISLSSRHVSYLSPPCVLACRPASRSSSGCGCGCHHLAYRRVCCCGCPHHVPASRCYRFASAPSRSTAPFLVSISVEMSGDLVDADFFFLCDFCAVG